MTDADTTQTLALGPQSRAAGWRLDHRAEVGSTNAEALRLAAEGAPSPLWLVADRQVAGRGRRGRTWVSPPGNLAATLLLSDPCPPARLSDLCFVAALALDDAVLALAPEAQDRFQLKWPNDGLLDGRKVAGILVEATTLGGLAHAAIGIGVNVAAHPPEAAYPTTSLNEAGLAITRAALFARLSDSLFRALDLWARGERFDAIRAGWLARAAGLGGPIRIQSETGAVEGLFVGLDAHGRLILERAGGRHHFTAGDVLLNPESIR